jgi:hypothetical protein
MVHLGSIANAAIHNVHASLGASLCATDVIIGRYCRECLEAYWPASSVWFRHASSTVPWSRNPGLRPGRNDSFIPARGLQARLCSKRTSRLVLGTSVTERETARVGFSAASPYITARRTSASIWRHSLNHETSFHRLRSTALDCASSGRLVARSFRPDRQPDATTDEDRLPLRTPFLNFGLGCERRCLPTLMSMIATAS